MPNLQQSELIEFVAPQSLKPHPLNVAIYGDGDYQDLADSIKNLGVLQALYVTSSNVILSGHRRWRAAIAAACPTIPIIRMNYTNDLDERQSIIEHNRYRIKNGRQLWNEGQELDKIGKERGRQKQSHGLTAPGRTLPDNGPKALPHETRDFVAKSIGLSSGRQWDRLADVAAKAPELLDDIKPHGLSISGAYSQVRKRERLAKLAKERQAASNIVIDKSSVSIHCGDFRKVLARFDSNSIDHIFTDPPYSEAYLPLWNELSAVAERILKPGGLCICYSGTYHLPETMAALGTHLSYCWQLILLHEGTWQRIQARSITTGYKPILIYYKPPYRHPLYDVRDIVIGTGREKNLHDWAQALGEAADILGRLTTKGQTILDPFMGSGTIPLAAVQSKRQAIGIDSEQDNCNIAKKRIHEWEITTAQT